MLTIFFYTKLVPSCPQLLFFLDKFKFPWWIIVNILKKKSLPVLCLEDVGRFFRQILRFAAPRQQSRPSLGSGFSFRYLKYYRTSCVFPCQPIKDKNVRIGSDPHHFVGFGLASRSCRSYLTFFPQNFDMLLLSKIPSNYDIFYSDDAKEIKRCKLATKS